MMARTPPATAGRTIFRTAGRLSALLAVVMLCDVAVDRLQKGPGYAGGGDIVTQPSRQMQCKPASGSHKPCPLQTVLRLHDVLHSTPYHPSLQRHCASPATQCPCPEQFLLLPLLGMPSQPLQVPLSPLHTPQLSHTAWLAGR